MAQAQARSTEETAGRLAELGADVQQIARAGRRLGARASTTRWTARARRSGAGALGPAAERATLGDFGSAATRSASSIESMIASAAEVGASTEQLLAAVRSTADSMASMETATSDVSAHVETTARLSGAVVTASEDGRRLVRSTVAGMDTIRSATDEVQTVIASLRQRADAIGRVLAVIDEVTDETALLALNAAIIAAQAGERGKAFAVVADEMKALANRVQEGAKEIDGLVGAVQAGERQRRALDRARRRPASTRSSTWPARPSARSTRSPWRPARAATAWARARAPASAQKQVASEVAKQMDLVRQSAERIREATARAGAGQRGRAAQLGRRCATSPSEVRTRSREQARGAARIGTSIEAVQRAVREITARPGRAGGGPRARRRRW